MPRVSYPITLQATFATLSSNTVVLNSPPAANNPIPLTFSQVLPKVARVRALQDGKEVLRLKPGLVTMEAANSYGHSSACNTLQMPQSQRTWGVFWGSKAATRTGGPVSVDQPNFLKNLFNAHPDHAGDPALDCPD